MVSKPQRGSHLVAFRLEPRDRMALYAAAEQQGASQSEVIRRALRAANVLPAEEPRNNPDD